MKKFLFTFAVISLAHVGDFSCWFDGNGNGTCTFEKKGQKIDCVMTKETQFSKQVEPVIIYSNSGKCEYIAFKM